MKVFVAGATGVIGGPLVRQLVAAGHEVTGTTRSEKRAGRIAANGGTSVICDVLDADAVMKAVTAAAPDVVVNQLTALPKDYNPKDPHFYDQTNRLRSVGGHNLIEAAKAAGVRRFITQSLAFMYRQEGTWIKTEDDALDDFSSRTFGKAFRTMVEHERELLDSAEFEALVLRYGFLYGPDTYYATDGSTSLEIKKRRFPVVGAGSGTFSFLHPDDAASATVRAVGQGAQGVYNIVDDEPAPLKDWLPVFAEALGAKPPRHVPLWLAKLAAGKDIANAAVEMRGASNKKAKEELGWQPNYSSWRQGFADSI